MTKHVQLELQIGANFAESIALPTAQTGRTHRAHVRETISSTTVKLAFSTGAGNIALSGDTVTLTAGADVTELLNLTTDTAFWVIDIESVGETNADVRREASGTVLVSRDVTRTAEPTPAANASKLLTYSLDDGQTLTSEEQEHVREKIGITGGAGAVRYDEPQSLELEEQAQGRENISVPSSAAFNDLADTVLSKANQSALFAEASARASADNALQGSIDAINTSLATVVVTTELQSFADEQKTQARTNIGAAAEGAGGMAIGSAVTGATNNRLLFVGSGGTLQQQDTWFFADLGFGAIMPTRQVLRTAASDSGFIATFGSGIIMGRADNFPSLYVGASSFNGCVVQGAYGWGNNANSPSSCDAKISRRAANIVKGAALAALTYTVATKPDEATWIDCTVVFVDSSRGRRPCYSDGTDWRFLSDDAILS